MFCLIPVHRKDIPSLKHCVAAIRENVPEVDRVFIAAAADARAAIDEVAGDYHFVDERELLAEIAPGASVESGWILQQILKLGASRLAGDPHWLAVDADTVFLRPMRFVDGGRSLLTPDRYRPPEGCRNYSRVYELLLGAPMPHPQCFVAHHMVFDREVVRELLAAVRIRPWWATLQSSRLRGPLPFSEYDFYAAFLSTRHPGRVAVRDAEAGAWLNCPWRWWEDDDSTRELFGALRANGWAYVSCHHYLRATGVTREQILEFARQAKGSGGFEAFAEWRKRRGPAPVPRPVLQRVGQRYERWVRGRLLDYRLWSWRRQARAADGALPGLRLQVK